MASNIVKYILQIKDKGATKSLKDVGKASEKTSKDLKKLGKDSKSTSKSMKNLAKGGSLVGAAIAAAGAAIAAFGQSQADTINSLNDLSTRSGVASEKILALKFAFVASGQAADSVQGLLDKMPKMMAELARGTGSASIAAERLGVSVFDAGGKLKDSSDLFVELTEELQNIESGTERATVAAELFGRQAGNMLQAFGQTEGLKTFVEFTEKYGVSVGPEATKQAAQFQQGIAILDLAFQKFLQTFGLLFGDKGFLEPILAMAKAFVFVGAVVETTATNVPQLFDFMFNRINALIANFIGTVAESFIPLLEIMGLDGWAGKLEEQRNLASKTLKLINEDMNLALDTSAFERVDDFDKDVDQLLKTLQKAGKGTGTVIDEAGKEAEEAASKAKEAWKEFFDVLDDYEVDFSDAFDQIADGINEALQAMQDNLDRIVSNIEKAAGVLSGIASGDIIGAASQFMGPVGGAVAGGVSAISDIGQRVEEEGTEFLKLDIENFVRGFIIGLAALPAILIEVLPPLLFQAAGQIINAIIALPFHIGKAIIEAWQSMGMGKEERQRRREEHGRGANIAYLAGRGMEFTTGLDLGLDQMMSGGRFIPSAMSGMFTGGRRGLAMLHENEFVVPASGQMPQSVGRQFGSGGGITININADIVERNAVDELVRRIERQFNTFGSSTSPLFNQG